MESLPKRPLGKTGYDVSVLALGGVKYNFLPDAEAAALVNRAIDLGINYIDTANGYKDSERKIGLVLRDRRSEVYLATKSMARDRDGMARDMEESLRRLQTDHIDCVQIHDLAGEADLAAVTAPDGALKAIESFRAAGTVRFVGLTGHKNPDVLAKGMKEYPFDTVLCAMGALHEAARPFQKTVLPVARQRGVGVLGMKVLAYAFLAEHAEKALRFVLGTEGIAAAVVGAETAEHIEFNARVARALGPLSDAERAELIAQAGEIYRRRKEEAWFIVP
jgi:aryl-alcohol dehydrogenase-like predicted oxidoreductase